MTKGIDLREVDDFDLQILEYTFLRERKVQLYSSLLSCANLADPEGVMRMLKEELFPEYKLHSDEFRKRGEKVMEKFIQGDEIIRLTKDEHGQVSGREEPLSDIENLEDIHQASRIRGRR